jgi:hypothetical protein
MASKTLGDPALATSLIFPHAFSINPSSPTLWGLSPQE